jgi:hypothetical protein
MRAVFAAAKVRFSGEVLFELISKNGGALNGCL